MIQMQRRSQGSFSLLMVVISFISSSAYGNSPPSFTKDMNLEVISEETPVGTIVYTLEGFDPEGSPVKYGIMGTDKFSVDENTGEVKVANPLDHEVNETLEFFVTIEDEVKGEGDVSNNLVQVPIFVIIQDENDNAPVFLNTPYEVVVPEDTPINKVILNTIKVEDPDFVGEGLEVTCLEYSENADACSKFVIVPDDMTTKSYNYTGSIVLNSTLDFAQTQFYRLILQATDGKHKSKTYVDIRIGDVQNTPPIFSNSSFVGEVFENAPIGTVVLMIEARDGDIAQPRPISYDLLTNPSDFFLIDSISGELKTAKPLDREILQETNGVVSLTVRAREMVDGKPLAEEISTSFAQVTVTIKDVNDERPLFNKQEYFVTIPEDIPEGSVLPDLDMFVIDSDLGLNSAFSLRLEDVSKSFVVEPETASGSTKVIIRVKNSSRLDFEDPNQRKYIILVIAEETMTEEKLSSTATLIVQITDVNDNAPMFERESYTASISETAQPGTVITNITALDPDSGELGANSIQYELSGEHAEKFLIDPKLGLIAVGFCSTPGIAPCLDYEAQQSYTLILKATDNFGEGHTNAVSVTINLIDANDNPPEFAEESYTANIDEGSVNFEPRLIIQATDVDKSSTIEYSLEETYDQLAIDSSTGEITVINPNGLETNTPDDSVFALTLKATDGMFVTKVPLAITVVDINNNEPIFEREIYAFEVPEDIPMGASIVKLTAHDNDEGINAAITYRIEKGANNDFNVNNQTGVVFAASKLDFDKRDKYSIHVIAVDGGVPSLTGTTTVNISVTNINDKEPYFTPTTQRAEVLENVATGTIVHKLVAKDMDISDPSALKYNFGEESSAIDLEGNEIMGEDFTDFFHLDEKTGIITISKTLNREIAVTIKLTVIVTDQTAPVLQQGMGQLIVNIIDVNDIPPEFEPPWTKEEPNYFLEIEEEQPNGTLLGKFTANDKDSHIALYALESDGGDILFSINNQTGEVFIQSRLDYEVIQSVNFTLVAYDSGVPQLSTSANVYVKLVNINDNAPIFSQTEYNASIKENSPFGSRILPVSAEDADLGEYGKISYELKGELGHLFRIESDTGLITVSAPEDLDRESFDEIQLQVIARDIAPPDVQKTATVPVNIKLLDVNDNKPVFRQSTYTTSIVENIIITPSPKLLQLVADDKDENPHLTFKIVAGNEDETFAVDSDSGVFTIQGPLTKGKTEYNLMVQVSDGLYSDTARVVVTILPVNLEKPSFVHPPASESKAFILENSPIGFLIIKVEAQDHDTGENGRVSYHFKVNGSEVQDTQEFNIDSNSGEIITRTVLDREIKSSYQVHLVARDHGSPTHLEAVQPLTIFVEDEDDNLPLFSISNQTYIFFIKENVPLHSRVGKVEAIDLDEGNNSRIFYFIISGNDNASFEINKMDGTIRNNINLDRETESSYEIFVKASSDEDYTENEKNSIDDDDSVVLVRILVEDENDNSPEFEQDQYFTGISSNDNYGQFVTQVNAVDLDEGENSEFSFLIMASHLYKSGLNVSSGSVVPAPFSIDDNGKITTSQRMAEYNQDRFKLEVVARENSMPYREATAIVNVWIYEPQQLIKIILSRPPAEVTVEKDEIVAELSNATNSLVVVDAIKHHATTQGDTRLDWSDMFVHVVDSRTQEISSIPHILSIIDSKYDFLKHYYTGFAIENVLPAHSTVQEDKFEPLLVALIALVIVLFVGLVVVCVLCCCCKHWIISESPSGGAQKSEMLIKKQFIDDLSITENPLWIEQKLKLYEEQELTMQVFCDMDKASTDRERRDSMDNMSVVDNTYATIQPGAGDYATLGGSIIPMDNVSSHSQQMYEAALGFQGSTFQVPNSNELLRKSLDPHSDKDSQPEFILELI